MTQINLPDKEGQFLLESFMNINFGDDLDHLKRRHQILYLLALCQGGDECMCFEGLRK